ncbi:uncharacterized protein J8A68_004179 [[Candida] subhashii]|uniref:Mitochondrial group I intron splicing factor CCM1 n=1 Tax=[Candida] subhashii TaxID=561895 RepID=A0A8J5UVL3_9ASCO|nr:uncharacterized protein J8A68_004179 [[Candida] subhashii]KAG7662285.1 hypothetical protein J8A68_004179 [[Candida] subhashii]
MLRLSTNALLLSRRPLILSRYLSSSNTSLFSKDRSDRSFDRPKFGGDRPRRSFDNEGSSRTYDREKSGGSYGGERSARSFDRDGPRRSFDKFGSGRSFDRNGSDRSFNKFGSDRSFNKFGSDRAFDREGPNRSFDRERSSRPYDSDRPKRSFDGDRSNRPFDREISDRPFNRERSDRPFNRERSDRPFDRERSNRPYDNERSNRSNDGEGSNISWEGGKPRRSFDSERSNRPYDRERSNRPYDRERSNRPYDRERSNRPSDRERSGRPYDRERSDRPYDRDAPRGKFYERKPQSFQDKLQQYIDSGVISLPTKSQTTFKPQKPKSGEYDLRKALETLISKYDASLFVDDEGHSLDITTLNAHDLKFDSPKAKWVFDNLMKFKEITKKRPERGLMLALLGTNMDQLEEPFYIAKNILQLLEIDNDPARALYLANMSTKAAAAPGMNLIMRWVIEKNGVQEGLKLFQKRKDSGIPPNEYTYVMLFDAISKASEWGKVDDALAERVASTFVRQRIIASTDSTKASTCGIEAFNACLNVLVKNFSNNLAHAWKFFDNLAPAENVELIPLHANAHTFSIMLLGLRKFAQHQRQEIMDDSRLSGNERILKLLDVEAWVVKSADVVFAQAMKTAMPPRPPPEDSEDEEAMKRFRTELAKKRFTDIDIYLVSNYISTHVDVTFGTNTGPKSGSHYRYNEKALNLLNQFSPFVNELLQFVAKTTKAKNIAEITTATKKLQERTDSRINEAISEASDYFDPEYQETLNDVLPQSVVPNAEMPNANPQVIMPAPPRIGSRNFINYKEEPLVMFNRRMTYEEGIAVFSNELFEKSRGKKGKKMSKLMQRKMESKDRKYPVNPFILNQTFDAMINLGRFNEYLFAMWYTLVKWGGVKLDLAKLFQKQNVATRGVIPDESIPRYSEEVNYIASGVDKPNIASIVDHSLLSTLMYRIEQNSRAKGTTRTNLIIEMFAVLASPIYNPRGLVPNQLHTINIWQAMLMDLHYYNDYDKAVLQVRNSKKYYINHSQLKASLTNILNYSQAYLIWHERVHGQGKYISNTFTSNFNKVINRLQESEWLDVSPEDKLQIHYLIVKAGILFYRPLKTIPLELEEREFSNSIEPSLNYIREVLSVKNDAKTLDRNELRLYSALGAIRELDSRKDDFNASLKRQCEKIYKNTIVGKSVGKTEAKEETSGKLKTDKEPAAVDSVEKSKSATNEVPAKVEAAEEPVKVEAVEETVVEEIETEAEPSVPTAAAEEPVELPEEVKTTEDAKVESEAKVDDAAKAETAEPAIKGQTEADEQVKK